MEKLQMLSKILKLNIVLLCFGNSISYGFQTDTDFENLRFNPVKENPSQRPITAMVKDSQGFLWIGTDGAGLYKFNGSSYSYYSHDVSDSSSINSNTISSLFVDFSGRLWIGTNAGLSLYDDQQNTFRRFQNEASYEGNYTHILSFAEHKERLLVGTSNRGVKQVDLETGLLTNYLLPGVSVNDLKFSTKGDLYLATDNGLKLEGYYQRGSVEDVPLARNESSEHITKLYLDHQENLWVGTLSDGVFMGDLKNGRQAFFKLPVINKRILAISYSSNHLLVAVENEGLVVLDMNGNLIKQYRHNAQDVQGIGSNSIWSILVDNENRIWLGYYENGMSVYDQYHSKFGSLQSTPFANSIQSNDIKAFAKTEDGQIWITQSDGIDIFNPATGKIKNVYGKVNSEYKGLRKEMYIENIFIDSQENVWLATWGDGVFLLKNGTKTFVNFTAENTNGVLLTDKIRCFTEDRSGKIWIGSFLQGVYYYDPGNEQMHSIKPSLNIPDVDVKLMYHDSDGSIWIGTNSGLFLLENQEEGGHSIVPLSVVTPSPLGEHPSSRRILDIFETQDGTVWFGTNGGGLFYYERKKQDFERYEIPRYDLTFVNAIFEPSKNELWISSKQGVFQIQRDSKKVRRFTTHDGLLENFLSDGAVLQDNNNLFYLGSKKGVNTMEPDKIAYNPYMALPYLSNIRLFNKKLDPADGVSAPEETIIATDQIKLKYDQTVLTIDYEAISYTRSEKNEYAYYLEGFEKTWNYVGSKTSATYTNLATGNYTFKLKASNNDNIWNESPVTLQIQVLPPWWKTSWAYVSYVVLIGVIGFSITYQYLRRVERRNTLRLEQERRKQNAELQQQKLQFFTNISHEFRTPLTLILNPIKELMEADKENFSKPVSSKHHIIHKNAQHLSRLINELMDFRKLQSNKLELRVSEFNVVKHTKNILSFFNEESKRRSIQLDLKHDDLNLEMWGDSGMLEKILFNLLSNAFKVTPNKGRIVINIDSQKKKKLPLISEDKVIPVLQISVKDNGPGIDQEDFKKIFKRFYQIGQLNKTYYGSTGVGLEMVKSFVKLHKGTVEVESELGKGSAFIISIPLGKEFFDFSETSSISEGEQDASSLSETDLIPVPYKIEEILSKNEVKKKLLIVEDNADLQDYLVSILEEEYELIVAYDGQEGWLKALEHQPDIIITDIIMPVMDGIAFSEKVKNDPDLKYIPLIMLTSKEFVDDRIKGLEAGADSYLVKPFEIKELKAVLEQLLLRKEQLLEKYAHVSLDEEEEEQTLSLDNDFMKKVVEYIQGNIENPSLNVENLSSHLCLSRSQVYRKAKTLTGLSPLELIRRVRLERSRTLFHNDKNITVSEVARKVGFLSASYFTVCYKKQYGQLPKMAK